MAIVSIVTLSLSGLLLLIVGSSRLSNPIKAFSKNSGIQLNNDVNLMNEMRGVSALMLLGAIVIGVGIAVSKLTLSSHLVAVLIFLGFALGRMVSMGTDGKPNKLLIQGLGFELVLGLANVVCLIDSMKA